MKTYESGQRAIYQEDGARVFVEIRGRSVEGDMERYQLRVLLPVEAAAFTIKAIISAVSTRNYE